MGYIPFWQDVRLSSDPQTEVMEKMDGLPENWQHQLMSTLIGLGCEQDSVVPEYPSGAEGPLEASPYAQVNIPFNRRAAGIKFTGGVWLLNEAQKRKIDERPVVFPSQFEFGLQQAKVELKKLLDTL